MITLQSKVDVDGISAEALSDFMLNCTDADYQRWWPGTHLAFHTLKRIPGNIGNLVYFDEYVGKRRLKFQGVVSVYEPGRRIVWQMKWLVRLPAWLILEFESRPGGVRLVHALRAGYAGPGRIFDPLLRLYLSHEFGQELDRHAHVEFPKLGELLRVED
jgi:hypothetical protein